jgi:hypothetical protein
VHQAATTPQAHAGRTDVQDWMTYGFVPDYNGIIRRFISFFLKFKFFILILIILRLFSILVDGKAACDSLSYAFDDWAVGNIALAMGIQADVATFENRSQNYKVLFFYCILLINNLPINIKNVWNADKQLFCPKNLTGEWNCPTVWIDVFDNRYVEGDAWQWRWCVSFSFLSIFFLLPFLSLLILSFRFVPHDPLGLISLFKSEEYHCHI